MAADVLYVDQRMGAKPPQRERRAAPRYPLVQRCLVRPAGASGPGAWHAIAYNISATGIGLALEYPVAAGTLLTVEPWGRPNTRPVQAQVVHSSVVGCMLFHGCKLTEPLDARQLKAWLT